MVDTRDAFGCVYSPALSMESDHMSVVSSDLVGVFSNRFLTFPSRRECTITRPRLSAKNRIVLYVTRGAVIAADIIVLIMTWMNIHRRWRGVVTLSPPISLETCLFRDGATSTPLIKQTLCTKLSIQAQYTSCRCFSDFSGIHSSLRTWCLVLCFLSARLKS